MGTTLILTGIACIVGAIIGGGVKLLQVEFNEVKSIRRQILLGAFGLILVSSGLFVQGDIQLPSADMEEKTKREDSDRQNGQGDDETGYTVETNSSSSRESTGVTERDSSASIEPANHVALPATTPRPAPVPVPILPDDLQAGLRLQVGAATGATVGNEQVRRLEISLELPQSQRDSINSVRYEFYNSTFRSPKYAEEDSENFRARWLGYGCINDAAVIADTASGEVRAPFDLCALWAEGRL